MSKKSKIINESSNKKYYEWNISELGISKNYFSQIDDFIMNMDRTRPVNFSLKEEEKDLDKIYTD